MIMPNPNPTATIERRQAKGNVNTGHESWVESADAIGRDEDDALIVFDKSHEARYQIVAFEIGAFIISSSLQEDICFIKQ